MAKPVKKKKPARVPGDAGRTTRKSSPVKADTMTPARVAKRAQVGRKAGLAEPGPTGEGARGRTGSTARMRPGTPPSGGGRNGIFDTADQGNARLAGKAAGAPQNAAGGAGRVKGRRRRASR